MREIVERESKWDVDDRFVVPDLNGVVHGAPVRHDTLHLESVYYDTAEGDLRALGILVRRRDGDDDTGWQVKLPAADGRTELRWPLSDDAPGELTTLLTGVTSGRPLTEITTMRTTRERYRIGDPDSDAVVAELVHDHVRASVGERLLAWREVEVELGSADHPPKRLTKRLVAAGARPSRHASKLQRVLPEGSGSNRPRKSALTDYLDAQIDAIVAGDVGLRRRQDPIHDTRVAVRRLRSTLRVFAKLLDPKRVSGVEDELKWFAGLLGEVRDCQVQQGRFDEVLDDLPDELVLGPVRARVRSDLQSVELPARAAVEEAMTGERYLTMLATLREWRSHFPVLTADKRLLLERAGKAARKADARLAEGLAGDADDGLHRARKAAKRARYAAELVAPIGGKRSKRKVKHHKNIQSVLGDHQDTVVAREVLRRMGAATGANPEENGFTFGLLYAREQRIAEETRQQADALR